jgi:hypothetical protein
VLAVSSLVVSANGNMVAAKKIGSLIRPMTNFCSVFGPFSQGRRLLTLRGWYVRLLYRSAADVVVRGFGAISIVTSPSTSTTCLLSVRVVLSEWALLQKWMVLRIPLYS